MSDVKTAALNLSSEDFDIFGDEDLTFLISPKLSVRSEHSNHSLHSDVSSSSHLKVSPIVTDETQFGTSRPALNSLQGYDEHNNPIYTSSQTPHDYQVMTKRKVSKKSIFNFEGVDLKPEPTATTTMMTTTSNSEGNFQFGVTSQFPHHTGTEGIAYSLGNNVKSEIHVKPEPIESLDDSKFTFDLTESVPHFLEGVNWNSQNSQMSEDGEGASLQRPYSGPLQAIEFEEISKNPRKKQVGDNSNGFNGNGLNFAINPSAIYENAAMDLQYEFQGIQPAEPTNYTQQSSNPWGNGYPQSHPSQNLSVPSYFEPLPSIRTLQENSQHLQQFPFPTSIITSTPPTSSSTNYEYDTFSNFSSPDHYSQGLKPSSSMQDLHSNYHSILQQKVEALKLSQTPNATESAQARKIREQQQQQQYNANYDDDASNKAKNRASKSLAEISRRFVTLYGKDNTMDYISGLVDPDLMTDPPIALNRVDGAAESLGVHVRRIYELIKILEILSLVAFAGDKRGKFSWRGTKDFLFTLGSIQNDGLTRFPQIAAEIGLNEVHLEDETTVKIVDTNESKEDFLLSASSVDGKDLNESSWNDINQLLSETSLFDIDHPRALEILTDDGTNPSSVVNHNSAKQPLLQLKTPDPGSRNSMKNATPIVTSPTISNEEHFMVEIICKRFLQLFLVGMNHLSMSHVIQKLIPMEKNQTLNEYNKANATKIRRVYDVTNVLCSLNLIRKKSIPKSKAIKAELFNNMDDTSSQQGSPFSTLDQDLHDCDEDSKGSGSKKSSKPVRSNAERGDTKVLEWASFSPHIIRKKYLERRRRLQQLQHQQLQQQQPNQKPVS